MSDRLTVTSISVDQLNALYDERDQLKAKLALKTDAHDIDGKSLFVLSEKFKSAAGYVSDLAYCLLADVGPDKSMYEVLMNALKSVGVSSSDIERMYDGKITLCDGRYWFGEEEEEEENDEREEDDEEDDEGEEEEEDFDPDPPLEPLPSESDLAAEKWWDWRMRERGEKR